MPINIPPPPSSGGGGRRRNRGGGSGGGGGSSGGGSGGSSGGRSEPRTNAERHARAAARSRGSGTYKGVTVFGQPITVADFERARQHYNDLFRSHLGRRASRKEVERLLNRGVSDYQLRLQLMKRPAFKKSPMFRTLSTQVNAVTGATFNKNLTAKILRNAAKAEGGINEASIRAATLQSNKATRGITQSLRRTSGADIDYLSGSFGTGRLNNQQYKALALQQSGLQQTTLGARLQGALDQALKRADRAFQGTLATPSLNLGPAGLQSQSLQTQQEPDIQA